MKNDYISRQIFILIDTIFYGKNGGQFSKSEATHTYLARRLTMITKVVPPGRGPSIALRLG